MIDVRWTVVVVGTNSNRTRTMYPYSSNGSLTSDDPTLLWGLVLIVRVSRVPTVVIDR
jgi:flavin reductase (DIM6/NTAB) family NADH-FMN oxidoreductase RutF